MMSIKRLLLILFVAIIICPQLAVADREAIIKARQEAEKAFVKWTIGPYLQNPSPTSMTICFLSDHAQEVSAVVENASGGDGTSHSAVGVLIPRTAVTVWKVRLTGLSSGTEYQYNIEYKVDGKQVVEKQHNFTTPSLAALTTHCIVLNDVHDQTWIVEELMKHVAPDDYEFSILLGDCWGDPNWGINGYFVTNRLSEFIRILNGAEKPILYVRGNHECRGNFSGRMGYLFDLPNLNPAAPYYEQDYHFSFAAGPLYFLFNDCGEDGNKRAEQFRPYRLRQAKWLASEIKKPAYRSAKYHIFASHIPLSFATASILIEGRQNARLGVHLWATPLRKRVLPV